jgi:hypothetical protein
MPLSAHHATLELTLKACWRFEDPWERRDLSFWRINDGGMFAPFGKSASCSNCNYSGNSGCGNGTGPIAICYYRTGHTEPRIASTSVLLRRYRSLRLKPPIILSFYRLLNGTALEHAGCGSTLLVRTWSRTPESWFSLRHATLSRPPD